MTGRAGGGKRAVRRNVDRCRQLAGGVGQATAEARRSGRADPPSGARYDYDLLTEHAQGLVIPGTARRRAPWKLNAILADGR
jgi:hypothetical protein